jgi:hypothetical protein
VVPLGAKAEPLPSIPSDRVPTIHQLDIGEVLILYYSVAYY